MNWKKLGVYSILLVLAFSFAASFVAAADIKATTESIIKGIQDAGGPVFTALFGTKAGTEGDEFVMRILSFIMVMLIVFGVLSTVNIFGEKPWINLVLGAIVSIIGIRFLPVGFLSGMAMPASAFVAVIVLAIPFLLLFFIVEKVKSSAARRAIWVAFAVLLLILWIYNWDNMAIGMAWWAYPAIILGCVLAFWFDGTLQKWYGQAATSRVVADSLSREQMRAATELEEWRKKLANASSKKERDIILREIKESKANLDAMK